MRGGVNAEFADAVSPMNMREDGLDTLAFQARNGDQAAFERLVRALLPQLQRWAVAQTGSADDAEDIAQEALLRIHRGLPGFTGRSRFTTWVYTITRRVSAEWRRSIGRRQRILHENLHNFDRTAEPDDSAVDTERGAQLVRECFLQLPARQREIFDLADLQNFPLTDIAQMTGLSPVTVRVHLHRARAAIRTRILARHAEFREVTR